MVRAAQLARVETARFATRQQRRQWHATAQAFAEHDNVGAHAVGLFGKQGAATADAGLYFVEDQQNPQFAAQAFDTFEIAIGRRDNPGIALDRLKQDRHGLRVDGVMQRRKIVEGHQIETRQQRCKAIVQVATV